jgi:hypothetical protein
VAALGPAVLALLLFAAYNQARFGSPTDFGLTQTLSPVYDQSLRPLTSLGYTLPNAYYYLVRPLSLGPVFPFLSYDAFRYPFGTPASYSFNEPVLGILTTSPLLVLGVVVTVRAAIARRARRDVRFTMSAALLVSGLITVLAVSTSIYGATQRYRVETDLLLTAAAVAAISLAWSFLRSAKVRRVFTWVVGVLAVCSLVVAVLAGYQDRWPFTDERNGFGTALADVTSPISDVALSGAPYVTMEPAAKHSGPLTLGDGFLLYPTARLLVHARGDCAVRVVLHRDLRDLQPLSVAAHGKAHVDVSRREIVIDVPPGGDTQVVPLTTTRYDGFPFTNITSGESSYDCAPAGAAR